MKFALHEEVPGGHDEDTAAGAMDQLAHEGWIGVAGMVRGEHDAVAGGEGFLQVFQAVDFDGFDAEIAAGGPAEVVDQKGPPDFAGDRRDEFVGFVDDDVLHQRSGSTVLIYRRF